MSVDYDLVILGGTVEGRIAAMTAVGYGARVALVEPPGLFERNQRQRYLLQGLQQLGRGLQQQAVGAWFGLPETSGDELNWAAVLEWSAIAQETQSASLSTEVMSGRGVDVVMEMPARLSRQLVVTTASRQLRSRSVLAAFGLSPNVFDPLFSAQTLPKTVLIGGGDEQSVQWAQALSGLGVQVSLQTTDMLPGWDEEVRGLVRSQLTTTGVMFVDLPESQIMPSEATCTLPLGTKSPALSLPSFTGSGSEHHVYPSVNLKLQTAYPRVFACGPLLGGSTHEALAEYEAKIAVKNALFWPTNQANYQVIGQGYSHFAKVGLTEAQAQQCYGKAVQVWEASHANSADLSGLVPLPAYCKLVCRQNRLVGVHLFGTGAKDLMVPLAALIGRPIETLRKTGYLAAAPSLSDLIRLAASKSQSVRWQIGHWRRDWAENWFNWRRSQSKF